MTLSGLIKDGAVCFLNALNRDEALRELVNALDRIGELDNPNAFYDAIIKREEIVSTGIGMGVAIPHAKVDGFDHFFLAIGIQKTNEGLGWNALDGASVRLIFMIGGPSDHQTEYLQILSSLTAAIKDEERRKNILNSKSKDQVLSIFKNC